MVWQWQKQNVTGTVAETNNYHHLKWTDSSSKKMCCYMQDTNYWQVHELASIHFI